MSDTTLKTRMRQSDILAGTFLKTPAHDMVEVLASAKQIAAGVHAIDS